MLNIRPRNQYKPQLVEGDGLEAPQKSLFYVAVHYHGH